MGANFLVGQLINCAGFIDQNIDQLDFTSIALSCDELFVELCVLVWVLLSMCEQLSM